MVIFLGFDFDEMEDVDDGAKNASYAHIAIHSAIMLVLEGIKWWTHFKGWRFIICLNECIPLKCDRIASLGSIRRCNVLAASEVLEICKLETRNFVKRVCVGYIVQ